MLGLFLTISLIINIATSVAIVLAAKTYSNLEEENFKLERKNEELTISYNTERSTITKLKAQLNDALHTIEELKTKLPDAPKPVKNTDKKAKEVINKKTTTRKRRTTKEVK